MWGSNPSLIREKLEAGVGVPFLIGAVLEGFAMKECLSFFCHSCDLVAFSHLPVCRGHWASIWISFRGNCSVYSRTFGACMARGKFRSLLCHHLVPSSSTNFFLRISSGASHKFWFLVFSSLFSSKYFLISLVILFWSMGNLDLTKGID